MGKRPLSTTSPIPTAAHADLKMERYGKEKGKEEDQISLVRCRTIIKEILFPSLFFPAPLHHLKCPVFKLWEGYYSYPFTSFEMCDDNSILLGVNKHNNSLIIVDIFNSRVYKNANMAILGTSGAGKTFTMQLMALRMRRRNIQVFIIAVGS